MHIKITFFLVCLLSSIPFVLNAAPIEITIAYEDKSQPPYYLEDTTTVLKNKPGIAVEMIQMLGSDQLKIKLIRLPWKRCLYALQHNQIQGIFNASYNRQRLSIGWYPTTDHTRYGQVDKTKRITKISYSLYKRKNSPLGWDGQYFTNLKGVIGAPLGYSIVADLKRRGIVVEETVNTLSNLKKLVARRIIAAALQDVTADTLIKSNMSLFKDIVKMEPPLATKEYYLMLSDQFVQTHPEEAKQIWNKIQQIRKTEMKTLLLKYSE